MKFMNNKNLKTLIWFVILVSIIIVLLPYILKFGILNISSSPESWGPFGDYFGGVLNPIIGILNLIVLTYLSINLVHEDEERNKFTLQELAKPLANFNFSIGEKEIKIEIENVGLGPLIISSLKIVSSDKQEFDEFKTIINKIIGIRYRPETSITKAINNAIIKKEGFFTILDINLDRKNIEIEDNLEMSEKILSLYKVKDHLSTFKIILNYTDMYGKEMKEIIEPLTEINTICR